MPDPEEVVAPTAPADQPTAQPATAQPTETALTREEVASLIASSRAEVSAEIKRDLDAAYKAARRSESKGDVANSKLAKLETRLEELATRGMDEGQAKLWKAERALERATETAITVNQQQDYERAAAEFQQRSATYLAEEGIKADDPRLMTAFAKFSANAQSTADWDKALYGAVAVVHRDNAKKMADETAKVSAESKTAVEKAREEERAKLRNEQRTVEGPVDRGQPSSAPQAKKIGEMSDEEFKAYDAIKDSERRRRMTQLR